MEYYDKISQIYTIEDQIKYMIVGDKWLMSGHQKIFVPPEIWDSESIVGLERYNRVLNFFDLDPVERHKKFGPIEIPIMEVVSYRIENIPEGFGGPGCNTPISSDKLPKTCMVDGRHRFMVMKKLGAKRIPVAMRPEFIKILRKFIPYETLLCHS